MADLDIVHLTVDDASSRFGVHPKTIRRWIKSGKLNAEKIQTPQGYEWRIKVMQRDVPNGYPDATETALSRLDTLGTAIESVSSNIGNRMDNALANAHADAQAQVHAVQHLEQIVSKTVAEGFGNVVAELQAIRGEIGREREARERREREQRQPWYRRTWRWLRGGRYHGAG